MRVKKKRKADRIYLSNNADDNLPVRKTSEIASTHERGKDGQSNPPEIFREVGISEKGKEDFEFVLKLMASPDNQ